MTPPGRDSIMSNSSATAAAFSGTPSTPLKHARSRTLSISSDRPSVSTAGMSLMSPPLNVSPEAAFIAVSAASQIVTNDHDSHYETWYDQVGIEPSGETTLVSNSALQLANNFVDQLLFNIISSARSTTLSALRSAAVEVLKPKLAKDAIGQADEELREYLGGGEVEDLDEPAETPHNWDVELAWKRTRLRCMVYSSLGDMEEEDEDYYIEQEHLSGDSDDALSEVVSPAVAIFLTSILEFMGEQVLVVSGQSAFNRLRLKYEKELKDGTRAPGDVAERIVVEDLDMERVALDRTLGRLWRSWKKRIRSPAEPGFPRPYSRNSGMHSRHGSSATDLARLLHTPKGANTEKDLSSTGETEAVVPVDPFLLPLPIGENDVAEIEVPGLVSYSDDDMSEADEDGEESVPRPKSWIIHAHTLADLFPTETEQTPVVVQRTRANSLPVPPRSRYTVSVETTEAKTDETEGSDNSSKSDAQSVSSDTSKYSHEDQKPNPLTKIIGGAAAVGSAAVAGVAALATGKSPQPDADDDVDDSEEPEVMTSSRVSIGGGSATGRSSPATSEIPVRRSSVRSARLVEVHSPRSSSRGSRGSRPGSVDINERTQAHSRSISVGSAVGTARNKTASPAVAIENQPEQPLVKAINRNAVPSQDLDASRGGNALNAASVPKRSSPKTTRPTEPPTSAPTLDSSAPGLAISDDQDWPEYPQKSFRNTPLPTLPEKSSGRQTYGQPMQRGSPESPKLPRQVQPDSPSSSRFKAVRSSEDSNLMRPEDVARNFEQLIQSDQTLQYTLTPENMRDIQASRPHNEGSPVLPSKARKSEDVQQRSRSSSVKRSLSVSKTTGLNSHPPTDLPVSSKVAPTPRSPQSIQSKQSSVNAQARDARIPRESMQDFAEFIRSTGPPGQGPPARAPTGGSATTRNTATPITVAQSPKAEGRRTSSISRSQFQARDAAVPVSKETSDLIDFLNAGPPGSGPNTARRAPPRQGNHLQPSKGPEAGFGEVRTSQASTNITEASAPSSMNSNSALLNKASRGPQPPPNIFDDGDMMPKRKQRRVRDPYAIDFSDEEDELAELAELDPAPKPKVKKEESLIDFLNNYQPPPEPEPMPPVSPPKKKSSAPNLIARLRSNGSSLTNGNKKSNVSSTESRSLNSRASNTRGYTPIQVNIPSGNEKFGEQFGAYSPAAPSPASSGRVPRKKFEPRDAVSSRSQTADLAKFLRDSEPPPSAMAAAPLPTPTEAPNSGFSRMFERRKKPVH